MRQITEVLILLGIICLNLEILVAQDSLNVSQLGYLSLAGENRHLAVDGDHVYMTDMYSGLRIIDVSNPISPSQIGFFSMTEGPLRVAARDAYAYVAEVWAGLRVINVSNAASPMETGSYDPVRPTFGVALSGERAYVANTFAGLAVVDVSSPSAPVQLGACSTFTSETLDLTVVDTLAYIAHYEGGLGIVDVSNGASPTAVGDLDTPGEAVDVAVIGDHAYVADMEGGLRVINVSNPASPTEVSTITLGGSVRSINLAGKYAFVATGEFGMRVLDISTPSDPVEVGYYNTPGTASEVRVVGNVAYVSDYSGLGTYDVSSFGPSMVLIAPNGGRGWPAGTNHSITWTALNVLGDVTVAIDRDYPSGNWTTLGTVPASAGTLDWTVTLPSTGSARMRVISVGDPMKGDTSDANFSIYASGIEPINDLTAQADVANGMLTLRWSAVDGATEYRVYRGSADPFVPDSATRIGTTLSSSFTDSLATAEASRFYCVTPVNSAQVEGAHSNVAGCLTLMAGSGYSLAPFGLPFKFWQVDGGGMPIHGMESFKPSEILHGQLRCGSILTADLIVRTDNGQMAYRDSSQNCGWRGNLEANSGMQPGRGYYLWRRNYSTPEILALAGETDHQGNYDSVLIRSPRTGGTHPFTAYSWRDSRILNRDQLNLLKCGFRGGTNVLNSDRVMDVRTGNWFYYRLNIEPTGWTGILTAVQPGRYYYIRNRNADHPWYYDYDASGDE